jgi:hypothetical protein
MDFLHEDFIAKRAFGISMVVSDYRNGAESVKMANLKFDGRLKFPAACARTMGFPIKQTSASPSIFVFTSIFRFTSSSSLVERPFSHY